LFLAEHDLKHCPNLSGIILKCGTVLLAGNVEIVYRRKFLLLELDCGWIYSQNFALEGQNKAVQRRKNWTSSIDMRRREAFAQNTEDWNLAVGYESRIARTTLVGSWMEKFSLEMGSQLKCFSESWERA
jgi:hypothetical protein